MGCSQCEDLLRQIAYITRVPTPWVKPYSYEHACYLLSWYMTLYESEGRVRQEAMSLAGQFEHELDEVKAENAKLRREGESLRASGDL
jgi:hypothetical protein